MKKVLFYSVLCVGNKNLKYEEKIIMTRPVPICTLFLCLESISFSSADSDNPASLPLLYHQSCPGTDAFIFRIRGWIFTCSTDPEKEPAQ